MVATFSEMSAVTSEKRSSRRYEQLKIFKNYELIWLHSSVFALH